MPPRKGASHPSNLHMGGKDVSVSYLRCRETCPRQEYWRYIHRTPDGHGLEEKVTGMPLVVGSAVHEAVHRWRESGWRDGAYDVDVGLAALRDHMEERRDEFRTDEDWADAQATAEDLFKRGAKYWEKEYPDFQVATDMDGPLLERAFTVQLPGGFRMTVIPDAVVFAHGFLASLEMKTPGPQRVNATFTEMRRGPQTLAETYILRSLGHDVVGVYVDVWVRGRTRTVQPFQRQLVQPDESLVTEFPRLVARMAEEIARDAEACHTVSTLHAKLAVYPMRGMFRKDACTWCSFAKLCWEFPGEPERALGDYRTRTVKKEGTDGK